MVNLPFLASACLAISSTALASWNYSTVDEHCTDIWDFNGDGPGGEAPTRITTAQYVAPNGTTPAYCEVSGIIDLDTGFEMRIPALGRE